MTAIAEEKSVLHITDATGDTRIMWDSRDKEETRLAKDAFDAAKAKGMLAYAVNENGDKGEVIRRFDPKAGKIIMTRQLQGG